MFCVSLNKTMNAVLMASTLKFHDLPCLQYLSSANGMLKEN